MALEKTVDIKGTSIAVPEAYCRVNAVRFDYPTRVWVEVAILESAESDVVVDTVEYNLSIEDFDADFVRSTMYGKLKTFEEWADAQDV